MSHELFTVAGDVANDFTHAFICLHGLIDETEVVPDDQAPTADEP